jgi:hypothetical protein
MQELNMEQATATDYLPVWDGDGYLVCSYD